MNRKTTRKRVIRYGLVALNIAVLGAVVTFVAVGSRSSNDTPSLASAAAVINGGDTVDPVDQVTSYDIAANIAKTVSLPEQPAVNNQAQSAKVAVAVSSSDTNIVAKPQIVATALKSRKDIQNYTAQSGDTVASIAQKFGVTSDTIKGSNNLSTNTVTAGTKLVISPVNGLVYTVVAGDTPQTLATKYKSNADQITQYNDAENSGLKLGEQIIIPGGQIQVAATATSIAGASYSSSAISFTASYGGNGYDFGYCTWYVATQVAVPTNWGNANTWAYYGGLSGWTVSSVPQVGAIAQTSRGYEGHVAVVNAVSADGTQIQYRDMNGLAGWGKVGYSGWVSASTFEHYIYH